MDWKRKIPGCFGSSDQKFALHKNDSDRAFALLQELRNRGVQWDDAREAFKKHLEENAKHKPHRDAQMKRIRALVKPWLDC